jgi:hypothetical protein
LCEPLRNFLGEKHLYLVHIILVHIIQVHAYFFKMKCQVYFENNVLILQFYFSFLNFGSRYSGSHNSDSREFNNTSLIYQKKCVNRNLCEPELC